MGTQMSKPEPNDSKSATEPITCLDAEFRWTGITDTVLKGCQGMVFLKLEESVLKGCNSYSMFSASIFQLCACLKRPFSSGDVRCQNFPKCSSEQKDLSGCTQVAHLYTQASKRATSPIFLSFNLSSKDTLCLRPEFSFCDLKVMRETSTSPEGELVEIKAAIETGFEGEPGC